MINKGYKLKTLKPLYLYAFLIPFSQKIATYAIVLLLLSLVFNINRKFKYSIKNLNFSLILLYMIFFVSVFYSDNKELSILEYKLSLLVFPIFFFFNTIDVNWEKLFKYYIAGIFYSSILCFIHALYNSIFYLKGSFVFRANILADKGFFESINYGGNYFFGDAFSFMHQSVYYAMYITIAIVILTFTSFMSKKYKLFLILYFLLLVFLISNKASIVTLFLISLYYLWRQNSFKLIIKNVIFIISIGILIICLNSRYKQEVKKYYESGFQIESDTRYGSGLRLLVWDSSIQLIMREPFFGVGVGDAQNELNKMYELNKYKYPLKKQLNAHNEFLQIWIELGIFGVAILILVLYNVFNLDYSIPYVEIVMPIIIIFITNFIFESVLNRFSGISVFSFFISLFYQQKISSLNHFNNDIKG